MSPKNAGGTTSGAKPTKAQLNPQPTWGLAGAPTCARLITIKITKKGFVNHRQPVKVGDCVQWKDLTGQGRCLKFDRWPFTEPWQMICISANGVSNVYHVGAVSYGSYPYMPDTPLPVGPPNPPDLVVGG